MNTTYIPALHAELITDLFKDGKEIQDTLNPFKVNMLHAAIGISGEVDELTEIAMFCMAKNTSAHLLQGHGDGVAGAEDLNRDHLLKELGDILFYEGALRMKCGALDLGIREPDYATIWKHDGRPMEMLTTSSRQAIFANLALSLNIAAGQVLDFVKKVAMYNQAWDPEEHGENLAQYLTNLGWVISQICELFRFSEADVRLANIAKLRERYPEGYSDTAAMERKDIVEAQPTD